MMRTISVLTWNTNNRRNVVDSLQTMLSAATSDVIFISLQEHYDRRSRLTQVLRKALPSYYLVSSSRIAGLWTLIFSRIAYDAETVRLGMGRLLLKKGAIITRVSSAVFVSCHLAPHSGNGLARLEQIQSVLEVIRARKSFGEARSIVIAGDVNFRISKRLNAQPYSELAKYDEALRFMKAYRSFQEAEITCRPTYKYINDTDMLDECRIPSWCDRVFVATTQALRFSGYRSAQDVLVSDHKPVICHLEIEERRGDAKLDIPAAPRNRPLVIFMTAVLCFLYDNIAVLLAIASIFLVAATYAIQD
jgi:endonuclease/exonuclease/phosphatase family metal-dependent hydrolase